MFPTAIKGATSEALPSDIGSVLQRLSVAFLAFMAFACVHAILYHLHYILAPFVLSGFLVFALEPSVKKIYRSLAGLSPPYRWCCCCMHRRWRSRHIDTSSEQESEASSEESTESEERQEARVLLPDQAGADWEGYSVRILDGGCRMVAVLIVLAGLILLAVSLVYLLASGALHIKDHWQAYQKGVDSWVAWLDSMRDAIVARSKVSGALDARVKMVYTNILTRVQELILQLVNSIVTFVSEGVSFAVMVLLYMLFWLFQPLPISGKASSLVQSYIWKKALVGFLYGMSVAMFLFCLRIDLPIFFGLVSFCLYFVPEVGAFISMLAPVPLILLNGNFESPIVLLFVALLGQVFLKLLIGNFLELRLVSDDEEMSLHPVWVLLSLNYFGFLWGPVGMLVSVPLLATLKSIVISKEEELREQQPYIAELARNISACLEGRKNQGKERRRSTWLLPFAFRPSQQKEELEAHCQPQIAEPPLSASIDAAQDDTTLKEEVGGPPKKVRQPALAKTSQSEAADLEEAGHSTATSAHTEGQ